MKNNNENENKIPNREEIPLEFRWDIQSLYSSLEEWEEDCQRTKKLADELLKYKDSFTEEATSFIKCLQSRDKILDLAHQVYTYAHMRKDEDNNDTQNQSIYNKASSLLVEIEDSLSFIQPGILSLNAKTIGKWIAEN
ncbi:MAG: hypothetical protein PHD33_04630 [Atribacterota bacterium]|nr:hypothetical protein [Atribacterota bacterium]